MSNWLYDLSASREAGKHIFRFPYPGGTWLEEKRNNEYFLYLMNMAKRTAIVGYKVKKGQKLDEDENKLLETIAEYI